MSRRLTVGVIGHVDHGKTALVRALTGMETDRLEEERRRGLSIVLGFAWFESGEVTVDLVDAPGHEAFVRTLVLGATGFDAALLVVAADEGIKPQTREHLAVARVFGLERRLVVAVSKIDRIPKVERPAVLEALAGRLCDLAGVPVTPIATSAQSREGLDALRARLTELAPPAPSAPGPGFWLPVDRAFVRPGFGLVVTGTLHGAPVAPGDPVELAPGGLSGTVRQVQVHGRATGGAQPGGRVALNLRRIGLGDLPRGAMVATPGLAAVTEVIEACLTVDADVGLAIRSGARVRLMLGAADVGARVRLLQGGVAEPGATVFIRLQAEQPIAVVAGSRFVLRRPSPPATLGGGVFLDLPDGAGRGRRADAGAVARLHALAAGDGQGAAAVALAQAGAAGRSAEEVARWTGAAPPQGTVRLKTGRWVDGRVLEALCDEIARQVPAGGALALAKVRPTGPVAGDVMEAAIAALAARGGFRLLDGAIRRAGVSGEHGLETALEDNVRAAGLVAVDLERLAGGDGDRKAAVGRLLREGRIVRLRHAQGRQPLALHRSALGQAKARLQETWLAGGPFTAASARDALNLTRRDTLPILEHFDATGVTVRRGDLRRFAGGESPPGGD